MNKNTIEDIYALSPMQEGMLFHLLAQPGSEAYFEQVSCDFEGEIDLPVFKQAWQEIVNRYPVFRTSFHWDGLDKPVQVVHKTAELPWETHDWSGFDETLINEKFELLLRDDRRNGFNHEQAPLMRCAIVKTGKNLSKFIWSHHHMLMDGWCSGIILNELFTRYQSIVTGKTVYFPPTHSFKNYISWLGKQDQKKSKAFWDRELAEFDTPTALGIGDAILTDKNHSEHGYAEYAYDFSPELSNKLFEWAKEIGITANTLIQGAWSILLSNYSRENEVVFGATVSGRPPELPHVESIVGLFINSLPVRININKDVDLITWFKELQARSNERNEFTYSPLVEIKRSSGIAGDLPLFRSLLVFENYPIDAAQQGLHGLEIKNIKSFEETNYPLTLMIIPRDGILRFQLNYFKDCFQIREIERLFNHLETGISSILNNPLQSPSAVSILNDVEKETVLVQFNNTQTPIAAGKTVLDLINDQVLNAPNNIAISSSQGSVSYAELNNYAEVLKDTLVLHRVKKGDKVALLLDRSADLIISILSVMKAGAAFLPIDVSLPSNRILSLINDAGVKVLITLKTDLLQNNDRTELVIIRPDFINTPDLISPEWLKNHHPEANDAAYVIYTSGSTGKPKGVEISHLSLLNYVAWANEYYFKHNLHGGDFPLFTSPAFDLTLSSIFIPLSKGKTIKIYEESEVGLIMEDVFGPQGTLDTVKLTPSHITLLKDVKEGNNKLKTIITGGEALKDEHVKLIHDKWPGVIIYNEYGPTEATIGCTATAVLRGGINAGKPVANTSIYILNEALIPVPIGIKGEIYIGGTCLAIGYIGQPEQTALRFIDSPFEEGGKIYRTGDIGCWLEDGSIQYFGRGDDQVKIRGHRIEPGEIEKQLIKYSEVIDAAVLPVKNNSGEFSLAAFIKVANPDVFKLEEIKEVLAKHLPAYMLPAQYQILADFPLTPNGKTNKKALLNNFDTKQQLRVPYHAPSNPAEEIVATIWGDILKTGKPGVSDNFFESGGHSLNATQMASRIRSIFKVDLGVREIMENQTIKQLAGLIAKLKLSGADKGLPPIVHVTRKEGAQLSFSQQRLWFLDRLEGSSSAYNIPEARKIEGRLNLHVLQNTFTEIISRHEIMRTNFHDIDGKAYQLVKELHPFIIPVITPGNEEHNSLEKLIADEASVPFNLEHDSLIRAILFQITEETYVLTVTMHHIISDGWSSGVFIRELVSLYEAFIADKPSPLAPLPVQYSDFSHWQRELKSKGILDYQLTYWKNKLSGAPFILNLPTDKPRPLIRTENGSTYRFNLSPELSEKLRNLSKKSGVTLFMTLLSAYSVLLSRYSRQRQILIGSSIANRNRIETERLIGFFINIIVYRIDLETADSFMSLIDQVRQLAFEVYAHQDLPFDQLIEEIQPERDMSYSPVFQVAFDMQNMPMPALEISGLKISPMEVKRSIAKYDLFLSMEDTDGGLIGGMEFNTDLFHHSTIERMVEHFQVLLEGIVANPKQSLKQLPLISKDEYQKIIYDWNNTDKTLPADKTVLDLISEITDKNPSKVAFEYDGLPLTYNQLKEESDNLARNLLNMDLVSGDRVGFIAVRSIHTLSVILGIMKAGGVYIPIDPEYPKERILYMLNDSGARFLMGERNTIGETNLPFININNEEIFRRADDTIKNLPEHIEPLSIAYIIYTSGSTGNPKGVMIRHKGLLNLALELGKGFRLNELSRYLQFASLSFDASIAEIFVALCAGSTLVMAPKPKMLPGPDLISLLETALISNVIMPPSILEAIPYKALPLLSTLIVAGEACSRETANIWGENRHFINAYGPTEYTVCSTLTLCSPGEEPLHIGRPIGNTVAYILDENLVPLPPGIAGELFIGGVGIAAGYVNLAELTAERFIPDPFSRKTDSKMYRTGDLAKFLPDGNICFLERIDRQVKLRGFRIEPGEIEAVLKQYSSVQQAVIQVQKDEDAHQRLVAFVTLQDESRNKDKDNIRISLEFFLRDKLPAYLLPNTIIVLDEIPLTLNGKIDQQALKEYTKLNKRKLNTYAIPHTEIEKKLALIWQAVLGIENVGIHHNFFELGGDSILSIQIVSRSRSAGLEFTPRDLFENQTIALLATVAKLKTETTAEQGLIIGNVPLSPIQAWFFEQEFNKPDHFNQSVILESDLQLDPEVFNKLTGKLVSHHDVLRMRFYKNETNEAWAQAMMPEIPADIFNYYELDFIPEAERENKFLEIINNIQSGLSIRNGIIFKVALFKMGADIPSRLFLTAHHLVIDGVSWRILLEDFFHLIKAPVSAQLSEKSHSLKKWNNALAEYAQTGISAKEIAHWKSISEMNVPSLPVDYQQSEDTRHVPSADIITVYLDEERTGFLLKTVSAAYRTQVPEILLAAFILSLNQWTGNNTAIIELEAHGREDLFDDINISRTVGWFTTVYPAVFSLSENPDPAQLIQSIKEQYRNTPGKGIGYGLLKYLSADKSDFQESRSPEIVFNYLGQSDSVITGNNDWRFSDADCGFEQSPENHHTHLLGVNLIVLNGKLRIGIGYDKNRHKESTINKLAKSFISNLNLLIDHCTQPGIGGFTPVDFPMANLDNVGMDKLSLQIKNAGYSLPQVSDIYHLSPLQQGLLFQSLLNTESVSYREQLSVILKGTLDPALFKKAWQQVINKYDILRTAFFWEGIDAPVQVVLTRADILWSDEKLSFENEADVNGGIEQFLEDDISKPFLFSQAPLMRFTLSHLHDDSWFFCWTHHHILMDGWCLPVITREVFDHYEALQSGKKLQSTAVKPYSNFIKWLGNQNEEVSKKWWSNYLTGFHHPTPLGIDHYQLEEGKNGKMQECKIELDAELENSLKQYSKNEGLTLNVLIHAAWSLLLSRYSGNEDVVFGSVVSGRPPELEGIEKMVGLFINSVPVRVGVNNDKKLSDWLHEIQSKQLERDTYSYTSLTKIREYSGVEGSLPLFDSLIIFENYPVDKSVDDGIEGLAIESVKFSEQTHYPVTLMVVPGDTLGLNVSYDSSKFEKKTIERLLRHLLGILNSFPAGTAQTLGEISLIDNEETTLVLNTFNEQAPVITNINLVLEEFNRHTLEHPEATALLFEGEKYSYGEISLRAGQLANFLLNSGLQSGHLVALCMDRSPEMIISLLAILKAGAAYLPLDPKFPVERLHYMLQNSGASIMLTEKKYKALWEKEQARTLIIEEIMPALSLESTIDPVISIHPDALAYVIYTSGSTGKPKGVQITHGALGNFLASMKLQPGITADDILLAVTTISFDIAGLEIFLPLISGATVALLPEDTAADPVKLMACMARVKPTIMQATPATWQMLLNSGWKGSGILNVLCGGEALPNELAAELAKSNKSLWNMYGPTETTIWSAVLKINPDQHLSANGYALIGGPIANTCFYILNEAQRLVPAGVAGELYIGGEGVARGYLGLPDEKFIPDPYAKQAGKRIYRTGDMAKWTYEGTISFLGRLDQQVKIRGFRIETGEIESAIKEIKEINDAVVIAGKDHQDNDCLLAFIIMKSGENISSANMRDILQAKLPVYMIPSAFINLDEFPLTPNGKTDRKTLKNNYKGHVLEASENYMPPATQLQQKLHDIWTAVLGLSQIGIKDNFFAIGGHSLLATQCISRIRTEFDVEFPLKKLFDHPDIESFAASLQLFIDQAKEAQVVADDDNEVFEF